jgi:glycine amidinotransferase
LGVKVYRPNKLTKVHKIKTLTYETEASSANNVRDITFIYNDTIVETPICIRNRIFENLSMYTIFKNAFDHGRGGKWVKAPITHLISSTHDLKDWQEKRDFNNINPAFEMAIDAPNFLAIGRDVIVNVATDTQFLGYEWIKSLFPESKFHVIKCADSHIDGKLVCLKPGTFLLNPKFIEIKEMLPEKFKKWNFIIPEDLTEQLDVKGMTDIDIQLASSRGMDINILSLDENTVVVNKKAIGVKKALEENGFDIIEVELDNGEIFGGGIHCSTLDIVRDDKYEFYT